MKTRNEDILFFSSDKLAALGLESLLSTLPVACQLHELWSLSTVMAKCEKMKPRLLVVSQHGHGEVRKDETAFAGVYLS